MKFNLAHNTNKNSAWTYETVPNHTSGDNSTKPGAKKLIAGNIMSAVQKAQRLTPSHRRKKKSKIIEELKIFDAELEAQPEFNGFTDLFHSFELYRGKVWLRRPQKSNSRIKKK